MEHGPTDTSILSKTAEPPSMDERAPQLSPFVVTSLREVIAALATACAQARAHEESGDGVAGAAPGSRAAVGRWGKEMEELATQVMWSLQDRRRTMEELEEIRKKKQRLAAEHEELWKEYEKLRAGGVGQGPGSLWGKVDRMNDRLEQIGDEEEVVEVEVERVGKLFDSMEQKVEKLVVMLAALVIDGGQWMGTGARRSVAAAGGVGAGAKVEVDDVKVEVDDVKVEVDDVKVEVDDVKVEVDDMKVETGYGEDAARD